MPTRDEQKEERRALIMEKAMELFAKRGYANTKIGDIAEAANMSVGLLFHYFESKEKLLEELVRFGTQSANNTPRAFNFENPLEYFEGFLKIMFQYARENPQVLYLFVMIAQLRRGDGIPPQIKELAMSVNQIEQSAEIIAAGQQYGYFREGDPALLSFTFWSSVQGIMEQLASEPEMIENGNFPETDWVLDIIRGKDR